jgi:hypothetical protein
MMDVPEIKADMWYIILFVIFEDDTFVILDTNVMQTY